MRCASGCVERATLYFALEIFLTGSNMRMIPALAVALTTAHFAGCSDGSDETGGIAGAPLTMNEASQTDPQMIDSDNPFFAPSNLQFQFPPFNRIKNEHYLPAFEAGMRAQLEEVAAIAGSAEPATAENTIIALERTGQLLSRVARVFYAQSSAHTNDTIRAVEAEIAPKLAAHEDSILLDGRLFARVETIYEAREAREIVAERSRECAYKIPHVSQN